MNKYHNKDNW